jgi:hypothetical protein
MDHTAEIVLKAIGYFALAWVLVSISGSWPILILGKATLQPLDEQKARACMGTALSGGGVDLLWVEEHGFEPTGAFHITNAAGLADMVAWTKTGESTYLCVQVIAKTTTVIEFVTTDVEGSLTTTNAKDAQLFPNRPDGWQQQFSIAGASELWILHQEALEYLGQVAGFHPADQTGDLREDFARGMRSACQYVRSIPLWPLRVPYWYAWRRVARRNKSVRQLAEG